MRLWKMIAAISTMHAFRHVIAFGPTYGPVTQMHSHWKATRNAARITQQ